MPSSGGRQALGSFYQANGSSAKPMAPTRTESSDSLNRVLGLGSGVWWYRVWAVVVSMTQHSRLKHPHHWDECSLNAALDEECFTRSCCLIDTTKPHKQCLHTSQTILSNTPDDTTIPHKRYYQTPQTMIPTPLSKPSTLNPHSSTLNPNPKP